MIHFRDRNDIVKFVEETCDWGSIRIAMQDAKNVEYIGLFEYWRSPECSWGRIVLVTAGSQVHKIAIIRPMLSFTVVVLPEDYSIPWENWRESSMIPSDNPEKYKELRSEFQNRRLHQDSRRAAVSEEDNRADPDKSDSV